MTGFLGFAVFQKLRKTMARSCLSQPTQPVRLSMESTPHSDQDTFPKSRGNSWKTKVFYRKKVNASKFSLKPGFHIPNNQFPMAANLPSVLQHPQSAPSGASQSRTGTSSWSQGGFSSSTRESSPQSLSMENSILKHSKTNIGIIALHSPQTTFVLKWNSYLFSVWIFWWSFLSCSLLPKDWVFLYSRGVYARNYLQVPMCCFYFI